MIYRILLGVFLLVLTACQTAVVQKPDLAKLEASSIPEKMTDPAHPWDRFLFDIQIAGPDGSIIPQEKDFFNRKEKGSRLLIPSGSIGSGGTSISTQGSTGLWPDSHLGKEKAVIFIDVVWPAELGNDPSDLKNAKVNSARLSCYEWAQAISIDKNNPKEYERLKIVMEQNYSQGRDLSAKFIMPPYKEKDHWIFPILVTLKGKSFEANCL